MHSELEKEIEDQKSKLKSKSKNENSNFNFKKEIEFINQNQKAKSLLDLVFKHRDIVLFESMLTRFFGTHILNKLLHYRLLSMYTYEGIRRVEITGLGVWILTQGYDT
jgi:hypothetical protein